jgi:creatinine amidohydrolase
MVRMRQSKKHMNRHQDLRLRFGECTAEELREHARQGAAVLIPLGCTEQQGPHLPVDFDTWFVTTLCEAVAEHLVREHGRSALVLPGLPFGPTPEHVGFGAGYINLRQETHEAVVEDILTSLAEQGFASLFIWRGCGQHDLTAVLSRFNATHDHVRAFQPVIDYPAISRRALGGDVPGGHADSFATSVCLLLRREAVRRERIRQPSMAPFVWSRDMNFAAISDTGVIGDPTQASESAGARIWELVVAEGARIVATLLDDPRVAVRWEWHLE